MNKDILKDLNNNNSIKDSMIKIRESLINYEKKSDTKLKSIPVQEVMSNIRLINRNIINNYNLDEDRKKQEELLLECINKLSSFNDFNNCDILYPLYINYNFYTNKNKLYDHYNHYNNYNADSNDYIHFYNIALNMDKNLYFSNKLLKKIITASQLEDNKFINYKEDFFNDKNLINRFDFKNIHIKDMISIIDMIDDVNYKKEVFIKYINTNREHNRYFKLDLKYYKELEKTNLSIEELINYSISEMDFHKQLDKNDKELIYNLLENDSYLIKTKNINKLTEYNHSLNLDDYIMYILKKSKYNKTEKNLTKKLNNEFIFILDNLNDINEKCINKNIKKDIIEYVIKDLSIIKNLYLIKEKSIEGEKNNDSNDSYKYNYMLRYYNFDIINFYKENLNVLSKDDINIIIDYFSLSYYKNIKEIIELFQLNKKDTEDYINHLIDDINQTNKFKSILNLLVNNISLNNIWSESNKIKYLDIFILNKNKNISFLLNEDLLIESLKVKNLFGDENNIVNIDDFKYVLNLMSSTSVSPKQMQNILSKYKDKNILINNDINLFEYYISNIVEQDNNLNNFDKIKKDNLMEKIITLSNFCNGLNLRKNFNKEINIRDNGNNLKINNLFELLEKLEIDKENNLYKNFFEINDVNNKYSNIETLKQIKETLKTFQKQENINELGNKENSFSKIITYLFKKKNNKEETVLINKDEKEQQQVEEQKNITTKDIIGYSSKLTAENLNIHININNSEILYKAVYFYKELSELSNISKNFSNEIKEKVQKLNKSINSYIYLIINNDVNYEESFNNEKLIKNMLDNINICLNDSSQVVKDLTIMGKNSSSNIEKNLIEILDNNINKITNFRLNIIEKNAMEIQKNLKIIDKIVKIQKVEQTDLINDNKILYKTIEEQVNEPLNNKEFNILLNDLYDNLNETENYNINIKRKINRGFSLIKNQNPFEDFLRDKANVITKEYVRNVSTLMNDMLYYLDNNYLNLNFKTPIKINQDEVFNIKDYIKKICYIKNIPEPTFIKEDKVVLDSLEPLTLEKTKGYNKNLSNENLCIKINIVNNISEYNVSYFDNVKDKLNSITLPAYVNNEFEKSFLKLNIIVNNYANFLGNIKTKLDNNESIFVKNISSISDHINTSFNLINNVYVLANTNDNSDIKDKLLDNINNIQNEIANTMDEISNYLEVDYNNLMEQNIKTVEKTIKIHSSM